MTQYKYGQPLPKETEERLDAYIERIRRVNWFKPAKTIDKAEVERLAKASMEAFGVTAEISYKQCGIERDWNEKLDLAWYAARDEAWSSGWSVVRDAEWDVARGVAGDMARDVALDLDAVFCAEEELCRGLPSYNGKFAFQTLLPIYELGLLPMGIIGGKFVIGIPPCAMEFPSIK